MLSPGTAVAIKRSALRELRVELSKLGPPHVNAGDARPAAGYFGGHGRPTIDTAPKLSDAYKTVQQPDTHHRPTANYNPRRRTLDRDQVGLWPPYC